MSKGLTKYNADYAKKLGVKMNILEAREAAMAGKTVIAPNGTEFVGDDFIDRYVVSFNLVFGEWSLKQEQVVFETTVIPHMNTLGLLKNVAVDKLGAFIGKPVRVTVEVIDESK